ncbi:signal peptidase II Aspartic peptidase. MEROPS family A08 [Pelagirhabdus alkalitolerans]|uniref:Lipoprotein signal peptidase n=1 Tax=Pelagirhabdus alkalitolerans TaxID=1612202 RepID=A0A1G6H0H1_9BACI|nr:signal peptidase II Aspartic peptidase. MEROPS family A08 [Pelagirhabdus alkalitolerans]
MYYYLLAIIIIALDQMTKRWVVVNMELRESIPVIEDIFYITSHRNPGAAWGILQDQMYFFYIVTIIVIGVIVYYMTKYAKENMWIGIGLGLVLGGAIGNFIDRLIYQEVVDFLNVYIGTYNYPIFNVADSALVVGVIILAILTIKDEFIKG